MYLGAIVLDCADADALADFYAALLGWQKHRYDEEWVFVKAHGADGPGLLFQQADDYIPPVWPAQKGAQQQMAHLDFYSGDVVKDINHALACGARLGGTQCDDGWRVLLDPAGHPFCVIPTEVPNEELKKAIAQIGHSR